MPTRSFDVPVGTTTLHVHEHSAQGEATDRPALVFLHYFGGSGRTWEPVAAPLAARGWLCLAPDLRGFGASPASGDDASHYTVDTMADDLQGLVTRQSLDHFTLIGHSMGGKVALALAARRPAGLAGVALLAPSPPTPEPMEDAERARLLSSYGDAGALRETLRQITAHPLPPALTDATIADNLRAAAPAWRAWLERGSREDISARLPQVNVGVRVAVGAKDKSITAALVKHEILARLPSVKTSLDSLPGVGHLLPLEATEQTVNFLTGAFTHF